MTSHRTGFEAPVNAHKEDSPEQGPGKDGGRKGLTPQQATVIVGLLTLVGTAITIIPGLLASDSHKTPEPDIETSGSGNHSHSANPSGDSELELADVSPAARKEDSISLDAKIRNKGDKTSIIKRVTAHVTEWRTLDRCLAGAALPVSTRYRLTFPSQPITQKFDVSTEINDFLKPNEASRIRITAGLDSESPNYEAILLRFTLEFDFDKSGSMTSDPVIISLPAGLSIHSLANWKKMQSGKDGECSKNNIEDLGYMLSLPGRRDRELEGIAANGG
ncbi:hypothetical protein ACFXPI_22770 [Streptomyces sp. NPDC059104]|uniref:hypothetical protein n=1 Tax=Streptomyces sp. NPDC059104 TaxID=3346729 RepID=UPI0036BE604B